MAGRHLLQHLASTVEEFDVNVFEGVEGIEVDVENLKNQILLSVPCTTGTVHRTRMFRDVTKLLSKQYVTFK